MHHRALEVLRWPWVTGLISGLTERGTGGGGLGREVFGIRFRNPVGLAAGFDKDGRALMAWQHLGFGHAEIGTITPRSQSGNDAPRLFRLPSHHALINRLGFPNLGAEAAARHFAQLRLAGAWPRIPIGINIGKQKETPLEEAARDYAICARRLRPFADYFAINVSSPNTPGLRTLLQADFLGPILDAVCAAAREGDGPARPQGIPVLVKVSPDMENDELAAVTRVCLERGAAGIIATNTTVSRPPGFDVREQGGLSGHPLRARSTEVIRFIHRETQGRLPIIGVGGITTATDAHEKLDAGAALVQLYTGFIYEGPLTVRRICEGLMRIAVARPS